MIACDLVTGFDASSGELACDGVALSVIARREGTPLYVYSGAALRERYRALDEAFLGYPHRIHYALKANSTLSLVRLLRDAGSAMDANSIWEIDVARRAGVPPSDVVFTGVGKSPAELECAVALGVKAINVESAGELARVEAAAKSASRQARVAIRVNPDIDARSHRHISTGLKVNKFGVPADTVRDLVARFASWPSLTLVALHVHVGSQMTSREPIEEAARFVAGMTTDVVRAGIPLEYVDVGGGLGISYDGKPVIPLAAYAAALVQEISPTGLPIVVEPGRSLVGPVSVLVASVIDIKPRTADTDFAVIDAGMTELMRPALYDAFHRIEPVRPRKADARQYEIVGPVCESTDVVGRDRTLPALEVGDLLAIGDAGAYGAAMASNYNRRPLPVEVLVDGGEARVIRRRQTVDDLLRLEQ